MEDSVAWMVDFRGEHRAAVGKLELVHVLPDPPELFSVLKAPRHCRQVFLWQGHLLPVFDLSLWMGEEAYGDDNAYLGIFRYRPGRDEPLHYGSLMIEGAPHQVQVNDRQACDLPPDPISWQQVAHACFDHAGQPVPVLNLQRIFGQPL